MALTKAPEELLDKSLTSALTITTADNNAQLILVSTDADASTGPQLDLTRNSGSPADSDTLGRIRFVGKDDGGNELSYGHMTYSIVDASDGSEDGKFEIDVRLAGTNRSRMLMSATETVFNNEQVDLDFRIEGDSQANLFVVNAGTDDIGIGMSDPTFATGNGMQFADDFYLGFGTGNGTRPDFTIHGDNNGLGIACGTGADTVDVNIDTDGNLSATKLTSNNGVLELDNDGTHNGVINAYASLVLNIDSDANSSGEILEVAKDRTSTSGGTSLFKVNEDGTVQVGRGSGTTDYGLDLYATGHLYLFVDASGNDDGVRLYNNAGTLKASIECDGDYIDHSDENYKENIADASSVLSTIADIKVRSFNWKEDGRKQSYGFVAQELKDVVPEATKVPEKEGDMWGVRNSRIVPMLTKAIQEQQVLIETLQTKVKALEEA